MRTESIYFDCEVAGSTDQVLGWDKDARRLDRVESSEISSALASCERVTVRVRGFSHGSSFSFELDENHTIRNLGPVETGAAG